MRIAVTGTPGVGKTSLGRLLAAAGRNVVSVEQLARDHALVVGHDPQDDAQIVDVDALAAVSLPDDVVIDGHLSHLLPVDEIWVVRCDPRVLRPRLVARGYPAAKVAENVEAEAMDIILQEALDAGCRVVQRDATGRSAEELLAEFERVGCDPGQGHDLEAVDWSDRLFDPHGP